MSQYTPLTAQNQYSANISVTNARQYWWVNHKQTYRSEIEGGYIWSPMKNRNGARNQTYINLTLVRPGDLIISYAGAEIRALGVATSLYEEQPKPEFGMAGQNWSDTGWYVSVEWSVLAQPVSPKSYLADIVQHLPVKNSPLQLNGNGNQSCYLASISTELGSLVLKFISANDVAVVERVKELEEQLKADEIESKIQHDEKLASTEREQLVRSRVGQGAFRLHALALEKFCRLTGVSDERFLIASHIKPWRNCSNIERLDGNNGLMLAPHVDKLFDRGWVSFEDNGDVLIAVSAMTVLSAWGLNGITNVGAFRAGQCAFLLYHRTHVFKG